MKKVFALVMTLVMVLALAAPAFAADKTYKVAMICDSSISDGGWGAACYNAMIDAAAANGWETAYSDMIDQSAYYDSIVSYCDLGYDLIYAPGNQYTDAVLQAAEEYPDIAFALLNGLPLRVGPVDNDGRNILSIRRSPAARRAFWLQMKVNAQQAAGVRLRDMPEDWFSVPGDETPENSILAAVPVNRASRLMDAQRFEEAAALQDRLLAQEDLAGIYRGLLSCDRIFCELLGEGREETLAALMTKQQAKFMKSMKSYPSVLRTLLALALLRDQDASAAEKLRASFDKVARSYPYPTDIESERELIALAEEKAAG